VGPELGGEVDRGGGQREEGEIRAEIVEAFESLRGSHAEKFSPNFVARDLRNVDDYAVGSPSLDPLTASVRHRLASSLTCEANRPGIENNQRSQGLTRLLFEIHA
jgi:hypothetical protein